MRWYDKYLGEDIPIIERLLYITTFMSAVGSLIFTAVGVVARVDSDIVILFASICLVSSGIFFCQKKRPDTNLNSWIFLGYSNFFAFPTMFLLSDSNSVEIPVYFIIGITYGVILLDRKQRIIYELIQLVIDIFCAYYCFVYRVQAGAVLSPNGNTEYLRIEIAILMTGIMCGIVIHYRNYLLAKETRKKEEAGISAEKVNLAKDMFLVNVSHEIRTPLNAIVGTAEMVIDSDVTNHIREMASNVLNSSHALLSITTDLLDFSRMNEDSVKPTIGKYDIGGMLNDIVNLISVRLLDSNIDFIVDIDPDLPKVLVGDGGKIRQIIINMLSNAVKYTNEGYMSLRIVFDRLDDEKLMLRVSVKDTGIGIREENLESIFEPYNRSGEITDRLIEGNGLGMALCRKMATAMDGEIFVKSKYGEGSTFFFNVPQSVCCETEHGSVASLDDDKINVAFYSSLLKESERLRDILSKMKVRFTETFGEDEFLKACHKNGFDYLIVDASTYEKNRSAIAESGVDWSKIVVTSPVNYSFSGEPFEYVLTRPISCLNLSGLFNKTSNFAIRRQTYEGKFSLKGVTLLVVDDNLVNLEVTADILSRYDAKVITAAGGREGLIALESKHIDLVFLDYMMPDMDGIDTLKEIRKLKDGEFEKLPVVALTANVVSGAREFFLENGFDDYLAKPIEIDRLEKIMLKHLPADAVTLIINEA